MTAPLLDLARALDHAVMESSHGTGVLGPDHPPAGATDAEALAHYREPSLEFHIWCMWRELVAFRPWTTQPSVGPGAAPIAETAAEQPSLPESAV